MPYPPPHRSRWRFARRFVERLLAALDLSRWAHRWGDALAKSRFRRERQRQLAALRRRERQSAGNPGATTAEARPFSLRRLVSRIFRTLARHRLATTLVLLTTAGLAVGAAARPVWTRVRQWRSHQLVEHAREALSRGEWQQAYQQSASALMLVENNREAGWILLQSMREMGNPKALELGYWLFSWPKLPKDRRLQIVDLFANRAPEAAFFGAFNALPTAEQASPASRAAMARVLVRRGDFAQAESLLQAAPDFDSSPVLQLEYVRLLCARRSPSDIAKARTLFLRLQQSGPPETALAALRLLHNVPEGTRPRQADEFPLLDAWLGGLKQATTRDRLIAADQRLADGASPEAVVSDVVDHFGRIDPGETAAWLNRLQRYDQAIALATPTASQNAVSFRAVTEAQIALKRRDAARRTLASPPPHFHPVDLALLNLHLAELGNEDEISEAWARLLSAAEGDPDDNRAYELVALAEASHRPEERQRALSIALRHRWGTHPLYSKIEPLLATLVSAERTWEILEICLNIARYEPDNAPLQNNVAYLQCLIEKITPAQAVVSLSQLHKKNQGPDFALSLAFAHLANGQPQDALDLVLPLDTQPGNQSFLRHAIAGTASRQLNRENEARYHLDRVAWSSEHFLPEELRWFQKWGTAPATIPATQTSTVHASSAETP